MRLLHHMLEKAARRRPEKEALVHGPERWSFRSLDEGANRIARALRGAGLEPGDRVGILLPNSVHFVCAYVGISKAGGISVPINTAVNAEGLRYILDDAAIRVLIFHRSFRASLPHGAGARLACFMDGGSSAAPATDEREPAGVRVRLLGDILREESSAPAGLDVSDQDLACILYTSGSTGKPKGVMLSHANIIENTRSIVAYLGLTENDRMMVVLPFFYCYGLSLLHTHLWVGGSLVLENQFLYPNRVLQKMKEERVTGFAGVPSTFSILLRRSNLRAFSFDDLRYVTQAGGAMAPVLIRELHQSLPRTRVFIMYGQTEATARLSYLPPEYLEEKIGSVGMAIPNVTLKIVNERGESVKPGETGEIVASGPNVMKGYWNSPDETCQVIDAHGDLRTGDLGRVDEDGFLYIVDRKKDMIKSGAHRVSAKEVEAVILEEASVLECAVIGVEDEVMGESIKAFIVPVSRDGLDPESIIRFCKERLPPYKVPRWVEVIRALPKNEAGKVMKARLKQPQETKTQGPGQPGSLPARRNGE
ncbi:MAG: class I adenylate-forming enzyme family protein [bacterium]